MPWRWLVNGLGGLVGMMLAALQDDPRASREHAGKLATLIGQLQEIHNRLEVIDP